MVKKLIQCVTSIIQQEPDIIIGDVSVNEYLMSSMITIPMAINDRNCYIERLMVAADGDGLTLWNILNGVYSNYIVKKMWDSITDNTMLSSWRRFVIACDYIQSGGTLINTKAGLIYAHHTFNDLLYLVSILKNCSICNLPVGEFLSSYDFGLLFIDNTEKSLPIDMTDITVPTISVTKNNFELHNPYWFSLETGDTKLIANFDLEGIIDACTRSKTNS